MSQAQAVINMALEAGSDKDKRHRVPAPVSTSLEAPLRYQLRPPLLEKSYPGAGSSLRY